MNTDETVMKYVVVRSVLEEGCVFAIMLRGDELMCLPTERGVYPSEGANDNG